MSDVKVTTTEYFGGCPTCGNSDGHVNVGRTHWGVCNEHRTKWRIGENLFSGWREETEDDWRRNSELLARCREVIPAREEQATCSRCGSINAASLMPHSAYHHPICRLPELADDVVKQVVTALERHDMFVTNNTSKDVDDQFYSNVVVG